MAMNVVTLLLVLGITFMHSIFGFFSGLINVFCSIVSLVVAFGFYEALNSFVTGKFGLHPAYTEPVCLVGLFLITIIVVRTLADNYIRGNIKLPMAIDFGGAGACGFINAQIFVGMLMIGVQMLPVRNAETGSVIQHATFSRNTDERDFDHPELAKFDRNHTWTRSDEFTVGLFRLLSSGSMSGKTAFASVYPDFNEAVFFSTNTVQAQSSSSVYRDEKNGDGFKKGLRVEEWWEQTTPIEARFRKVLPTRRRPTPDYSLATFNVAPGRKLIVTKLALNRSSADVDKRNQLHLFRPTMLRLVGTSGDKPQHYVPRLLGNADAKIGGKVRMVEYDNNFSIPSQGSPHVYAYFEVDEDFRPEFVEYRRHARAGLPSEPLEAPPELVLSMAGEESRDRRGSSGRRTFGRVLTAGSGDNIKLPIFLTSRAARGSGNGTVNGNKFVSGRVSGMRSRLEPSGTQLRIDEFELPPNQRLLQINYKPKEARTLVGNVFNYVSQINQYKIIAANADSYMLTGYFAIVKRGDEDYMELFFAGGPDDPLSASYRSMLDFKNIQRDEFDDDDTIIGLLFLVPSGTNFTRIQNQAGDGVDIRVSSRR